VIGIQLKLVWCFESEKNVPTLKFKRRRVAQHTVFMCQVNTIDQSAKAIQSSTAVQETYMYIHVLLLMYA
jgi:hypothetical protein